MQYPIPLLLLWWHLLGRILRLRRFVVGLRCCGILMLLSTLLIGAWLWGCRLIPFLVGWQGLLLRLWRLVVGLLGLLRLLRWLVIGLLWLLKWLIRSEHVREVSSQWHMERAQNRAGDKHKGNARPPPASCEENGQAEEESETLKTSGSGMAVIGAHGADERREP